jgi:hypothetical protein
MTKAPFGTERRLLERHQIKGDFQAQAEFVKARLARYNCTYLGIDKKGGDVFAAIDDAEMDWMAY